MTKNTMKLQRGYPVLLGGKKKKVELPVFFKNYKDTGFILCNLIPYKIPKVRVWLPENYPGWFP